MTPASRADVDALAAAVLDALRCAGYRDIADAADVATPEIRGAALFELADGIRVTVGALICLRFATAWTGRALLEWHADEAAALRWAGKAASELAEYQGAAGRRLPSFTNSEEAQNVHRSS